MSKTESEHACAISSKYFVPVDVEEEFQSNCDSAGKSCLIVKLSSWRFLDTSHGFLPWRDEKHFSVEVTTDASNSGWAGILSSPEGSKNTRDYWSNEVVEGTNIAIKEARALHNTLSTFGSEVFNGRVTAFIDNSNLISFWNNEGSKSIALSNEIMDLFSLSVNLNISLKMTYVPSDSNSADSPSRFYSDLDCTLSQATSLTEIMHTECIHEKVHNVYTSHFLH